MRELHEVLGTAGDVRADVQQHHRGSAGDRHRQRQRGPVDATVAAQVEQPGGQSRAGRASRHERLRAALCDRTRSLHDRRLGRRSHRIGGIGGLGDRDGSVDHLDTVGRRADLGGGTEQEHVDALGSRHRRARGDLARTQIGPARIHGDGDHG